MAINMVDSVPHGVNYEHSEQYFTFEKRIWKIRKRLVCDH